MKHFYSLVAGVALATAAFAQPTKAIDQPMPPAPPRPDAPGTPINPNQNTPAAAAPEAAAPVRELNFTEADLDKDGKVSLNEYVTFVESRMSNRSTNPVGEATIEQFRQLDRDNDAFLSQAEATVQQQPPAQTSPGIPPRG